MEKTDEIENGPDLSIEEKDELMAAIMDEGRKEFHKTLGDLNK